MTEQSFESRARELVKQMSLAEKISHMMHNAPAIERLNIPAYNWWNECLHGVGRNGIATVFPQAIALAATWNIPLIQRIATAISDEARAKHHQALKEGNHGQYAGLTFWSPNINIFRDPRWGRGQETYGEDPYLTARMGVAFIKGLQGDDPNYLKVVATPKHYAVHSGPEDSRHYFDVQPSEEDLWDTYLPAFRACIQEAKAASIMGAYNRLNGEACCASPRLLQKILRDDWGFEGFVVSDCSAIDDIYLHHRIVATAAEAAALAVKAGCDLECACTYEALSEAVELGLIDEATIEQSVIRLFTARFQLGMFDAPETVPNAQIPYTVLDSPEHRQLALTAALESMVLLKNADKLLPLSEKLTCIVVIGPNAHDPEVLLGNYNGRPSSSVTPYEGIKARASKSEVTYAKGCGLFTEDSAEFAKAIELANQSELVIFVGGLSQVLEGEEGQVEGLPEGMMTKGDRASIDLPEAQEKLLQALHATGKPVILVLLNGSAIAINWANEHLPAILEAWYPGEEGGTAIASILFGDYNPAGRLPITFYRSVDDLPAFDDYSMQGRTYRYFAGEVLYPFGFGLSYTTYEYKILNISQNSISEGESLSISISLKNIGQMGGDEVVQLYLSANYANFPRQKLIAFERISLNQDETKTLQFHLSSEDFMRINEHGKAVLETGLYTLSIGGGQAEYSACKTVQIEIV